MYTFKIKLFQTQRTMQFLPKSFLKLLRDCKSRFECFKDARWNVFARERLKYTILENIFPWKQIFTRGLCWARVVFPIQKRLHLYDPKHLNVPKWHSRGPAMNQLSTLLYTARLKKAPPLGRASPSCPQSGFSGICQLEVTLHCLLTVA